MYEFQGIPPEGLLLLEQNRFMDSKTFYEEHKEQLRQLVIFPMQALFRDLAQSMADIDGGMLLEPTRCISRIRRDTRYTKDKHMYRANLWMTFSRPKSEELPTPCFYFEFYPDHFQYGCGVWHATPRFMECMRQSILAHPRKFTALVNALQAAGYTPYGELYKKEKSGTIPAKVKPYYNRKDAGVSKQNPDLSLLQSSSLVQLLKTDLLLLAPYYKFLMTVQDKFISERES